MKSEIIKEYTLILITSAFPFGEGETFIDNEIQYLCKEFKRVIIIAQNIKKKKRKAIPDEIDLSRFNPTTSISGFLLLPLLIIGNFSTCMRLWRDEIVYRKRKYFMLSAANRIFLIRKIIKGLQLKEFIANMLKREGITERIVFYSYWLNSGAHAISLINMPGSVKIARAHGSDLYEEKSPGAYLPLTNSCSEYLDAIFFVSENGENYFRSKYPASRAKLFVSRLGVDIFNGFEPQKVNKDLFTIVSCSNIIPLKRIDLIIKSLEILNSDKNIKWIHFGDGPLRSEMESQAASHLKMRKNINYEFRGHIANEMIIRFYSDNYIDLFLNTSITEGVPVSIMEAQSFGIPAIATDTGGGQEIVSSGRGILLPVDLRPESLCEAIEDFLGKEEDEIKIMRRNCMEWCRNQFNAKDNYMDFMLKVSSILVNNNIDLQNNYED